jgi:hypothetical protein
MEWDWEYISINRLGDVDVPCTVEVEGGDEPCLVHISAGELSLYGIDVEGKEPVELTDEETYTILSCVEGKIENRY